ncbi:MAG TPA: histidine--tRNA ligase [Candidatus Paceibacterota bacterium]|nr:histidine--tRNA ligase [Candidatus Paceibacterota bacterium]
MAEKDKTRQKLSTEPYKGVRDFYPAEYATLSYIFDTWRKTVEKVGYVEYEASILEPSELYKAKGAENEEMVNEQTYTFVDRGEREVTLRPEMTPTVARMVAAKRRELGFPLRYYSIPNVFRYERPQRGRLREHWQLNVDLFGSHSPYADAEIVGVAYEIMRAFKATEDDFVIKVGSRVWLDKLAKELELDKKREQAFYRCLDAKGKLDADTFKAKLEEIGLPSNVLIGEPPAEIANMIKEFSDAGINNIVWDPSIVRGFAYYTGMVFEVFDTNPQNSRALFGGGRYDNLTAMFDDEAVTGVGFGMGDVTMRDFLEVRRLVPAYVPPTQLYIAVTSPELAGQAQTLAGELRQQGVNVAVDFGDKKLGDQIKTASKHSIPYLMVVGDNELSSGTFVVRNLTTGEETSLAKHDLANFFLK